MCKGSLEFFNLFLELSYRSEMCEKLKVFLKSLNIYINSIFYWDYLWI